MNELILSEKNILNELKVSQNLFVTVLVCCAETINFINSENQIDIKKLLQITEQNPFEFYKNNFFILNFERFIINPLQKHFLDIETYFLSHLIWTDEEFLSL